MCNHNFFYGVENLNVMIKAVGREMHWPPNTLGGLFIKGRNDYRSIEYWYNAIVNEK